MPASEPGGQLFHRRSSVYRLLAPAARAARAVVDGPRPRHHQQPRRHSAARRIVAGRLPPRLREDLLHDVLRIRLIVEYSEHQGVDRARVAIVQRRRAVAVAGCQPAEAVAVLGLGFRGVGPNAAMAASSHIICLYARRAGGWRQDTQWRARAAQVGQGVLPPRAEPATAGCLLPPLFREALQGLEPARHRRRRSGAALEEDLLCLEPLAVEPLVRVPILTDGAAVDRDARRTSRARASS